MDDNDIPGLSLSLVKEGKIEFAKTFGYKNLETKAKATDDTMFAIASAAKTVTATAVMQLWEQGKFKLDDDINQYLPFKVRNPNYPDIAITFKMLLTHTSSITDNWDVIKYYNGDPTISMKDYFPAYFIGDNYDEEQNWGDWEPGTSYEYSNTAVGLSGYLVEVLNS